MRRTLLCVAIIAAVLVSPLTAASATDDSTTSFDSDGDGVSDIGVIRTVGPLYHWFIRSSHTGGLIFHNWGEHEPDVPYPADFDGDGRLDPAVMRFEEDDTRHWFINRTSAGFDDFPYGLTSDRPVVADFDGDGKADIAMVRPGAPLTWHFSYSSSPPTTFQFGEIDDIPVAKDFDGDGKADIAVRRIEGTNTRWFIRFSSTGGYANFLYGQADDQYTAGDYDGDGRADIAVVRDGGGSAYHWFVLRSGAPFEQFDWGDPNTDQLVIGDYDGDGRSDATVIRDGPQRSWFSRSSATGALIPLPAWGNEADFPVTFIQTYADNLPVV